MAIYMKIDGIDGNVTAKGHENWIEIKNMTWGVERGITTRPGNNMDRESSKPTVHEVTLTKSMCKTSPLLFKEACVGKAKKSVTIHICQTGDNLNTYAEYVLHNVLVSKYQVQADGEQAAAPSEWLNLNFDQVDVKYTPYDNQHNAQSPIHSSYNIGTAVAA